MTRPLRLLMTADAVGGVWQYALELAEALAPLDVETVLALVGPGLTPARRAAAMALPGMTLIETGLPLDWLAGSPQVVRAASRAIARLAQAQGVDAIQINHPALAAEPMPVPVVAAVHSCVATWWEAAKGGPMPAAFDWQTALVRQGLASAAALVCPSASFAEAVRHAYALPMAPQVVPNGRRPLVAHPQPWRDIVFTAGRLWDQGKNLATLDRTAARLDVPLLAAGALQGPNGERVVLDHVHALGALGEDELADQLARRPVFVSAARYEPFGLAVLEAAQAGCALVLADIPTFRELWGGAATFIAPDDDRGFARAIATLIADPAQRAADGEAAARRAARFTPAAMASGMATIYRATLSEQAAAA